MNNEGYQPNKGALDPLEPPKGGSGISKYENEGVILKILSDVKEDDIIIAKTTKPITQAGAKVIIDSLKSTFPKNKILLTCDGADISFIPVKTLNELGWFYRDKIIIPS